MIHIFPHWNWTGNEGQVISVIAYTNATVLNFFLMANHFGTNLMFSRNRGIRDPGMDCPSIYRSDNI